MFRQKTAQPWTCPSSTTPPAEQRACAGALAAAARLHRLHHEVSEVFDWIIVALTHIYPVYFWVSFDDHEAITTLSCGRAALRGENGRSPRKALPGPRSSASTTTPMMSSSPSTSSRSPLPKTQWTGPWQRRQTARTTRPCQTRRLSQS